MAVFIAFDILFRGEVNRMPQAWRHRQ